MSTELVKRKFFTYRQNNSGGFWIGPLYIIVEASSPEEADSLAELYTDVYFDDEGWRDCECCGARWYRAWGEGFDEPGLYASGNLARNVPEWASWLYEEVEVETLIRYYDGNAVKILKDKK